MCRRQEPRLERLLTLASIATLAMQTPSFDHGVTDPLGRVVAMLDFGWVLDSQPSIDPAFSRSVDLFASSSTLTETADYLLWALVFLTPFTAWCVSGSRLRPEHSAQDIAH
jgi:hypothetical protein